MTRPTSMVTFAVLAAFATLASACAEPQCPDGFDKIGKICRRHEAGILGDDEERATDASGDEEGGTDAPIEDAEARDAGENPQELDAAKSSSDAESQQADATCPVGACSGGACVSAMGAYSCTCDEGYTGSGTRACADIDECASPNACGSSTYPCVQTQPPGYACQGQFADWPMPDALASSKAKPSYDFATTAGVVVDNVTGLAWERILRTTYPNCTGTHVVAGDSCTWEEAKAYCSRLDLGGSSEWRLPTKVELESLVDDTRAATEPAFNTVAFPDVPSGSDERGRFWAISTTVGSTSAAWSVGSDGSSLYFPLSDAFLPRCVRAVRVTKGTPSTRYTSSGSNVLDTRTGLVWQGTIDAGAYTLDGAKSYCSSLGAGWRLPTKKELLTLIDPTLIDPTSGGADIAAIDTAAFPNTPATYFRAVNSSSNPAVARSWVVHFDFGIATTQLDDRPYRVRCVR